MGVQYESFENTVGKGEIACDEQFLLFSQCFLSVERWPFRSWDEKFPKILKNHPYTTKAF